MQFFSHLFTCDIYFLQPHTSELLQQYHYSYHYHFIATVRRRSCSNKRTQKKERHINNLFFAGFLFVKYTYVIK